MYMHYRCCASAHVLQALRQCTCITCAAMGVHALQVLRQCTCITGAAPVHMHYRCCAGCTCITCATPVHLSHTSSPILTLTMTVTLSLTLIQTLTREGGHAYCSDSRAAASRLACQETSGDVAAGPPRIWHVQQLSGTPMVCTACPYDITLVALHPCGCMSYGCAAPLCRHCSVSYGAAWCCLVLRCLA